jgi:hypothetical protein
MECERPIILEYFILFIALKKSTTKLNKVIDSIDKTRNITKLFNEFVLKINFDVNFEFNSKITAKIPCNIIIKTAVKMNTFFTFPLSEIISGKYLTNAVFSLSNTMGNIKIAVV